MNREELDVVFDYILMRLHKQKVKVKIGYSGTVSGTLSYNTALCKFTVELDSSILGGTRGAYVGSVPDVLSTDVHGDRPTICV